MFVPLIVPAITGPTVREPPVVRLLSPNPIASLVPVITLEAIFIPPNLAEEPTDNLPVVLSSALPKVNPVSPEVVIEPFCNVKSPIVAEVSAFTVPAVDNDVPVIAPASNVPDVDKFSFPKLIAPDSEIKDPLLNVKSAISDACPALIVPVVSRLSSPKLIPLVLDVVIEPFDNTRSPISALVATDNFPDEVMLPVVVNEPALIPTDVVNTEAPKPIALDADEIVPVPKVIFANFELAAPVTVPDADNEPSIVVAPASKVPVVDKLLSEKEISEDSSVICPDDTVIVPNLEFVAAVTEPMISKAPPILAAPDTLRVPVVLSLLSPNDSVLLTADVLTSPLLIVISPISALLETLNEPPDSILAVVVTVAAVIPVPTAKDVAFILPEAAYITALLSSITPPSAVCK